jgi:anti-anti-sigma factor
VILEASGTLRRVTDRGSLDGHYAVEWRVTSCLAVTMSSDARGVHMRLRGELDLASATEFFDRAAHAVQHGLVLDLGEVGFCDAHGLSALVWLRRLCRQAASEFTIVNANVQLRSLVQAGKLAESLNLP